MSWFLGYTGLNNEKLNYFIKSVLPDNSIEYKSPGLNIWYSQGSQNFISLKQNSKAVFFSGIVLSGNKNLLSYELPSGNIEGHYACALEEDKTVYLFNDQHGMRDIYYIKEDKNILFSTRIDIVTSFLPDPEINIEELSALWLLPHQIIPGSKIKGINKLGPGGCLSIKNDNVSLSNKPWEPDFSKQYTKEEFLSNLKQTTLFPIANGDKINLGLSGGIDSRVLLHFLLEADKKKWAAHTYGSERLPDVELAKKITDELGIKYYFIPQQLPSPEEIINSKIYPLLELTAPIGGMMNYSFYQNLASEGYTIIDGGNGELFRRSLFNSFLLKGKKALLNKDVQTVFNLLKREKADIFNDTVTTGMKDSALVHLNKLMHSLPAPADTGAENWMDMFFVKTSFPNYSGPSQNILDTIATAYMPFAQTSVLDSGFGLNYTERKNGRLFNSILKQEPLLNKYSFVKDHIYYPPGMGFITSKIYLKLKKKFGMLYRVNTKLNIVSSLKEYALDKADSAEVKNFSLYEAQKIKNLLNGFYLENKTELLNQVDWWLSFEIWRDGINYKK